MSTKISYSKKFIFIHNYKVAGTSISKVLTRYEPAPRLRVLLRMVGIKQYFAWAGNFKQHANAREVRSAIGAADFDSMFKFGFVRNPWDWQVSLYHYAKQTVRHYQHSSIKKMSFDDYIKWRVEKDLQLQKDFLCNEDGEMLLNFVGKLETMQEDFEKVCSKLGLEGRLEHANKSKHKGYRQYYNDATREMVASAFKADIEAFGYEF